MGGSGFGQLSFDFGYPPPVPRHGCLPPERCDLFFAALPDPGVAQEASRLAADLRAANGLKGQPRPAKLLHMTLCGVGVLSDLPDGAIARARQAADAVELAAFTYRLDHFLSFRHRQRPLVLSGETGQNEFRMLHIQLGRALCRTGFATRINRSLKPHLTLIYGQKEIPKTTLAAPLTFPVREFVLIRSFHGQSRHDYLGRWPLRLQ